MEEKPTSLKLKVEIKTTDTVEKKFVTSLVDCGATREFIDWSHFNLVKLSQPIPMYNVDGTLNKAGSIMEVVNLILHYKNHLEKTTFAVSSLGKQRLILGHSWLQKHNPNPEIDWITREVKMSRCPPRCFPGCRDKVHQQCIAQKAESWWKNTCAAGTWDWPWLQLFWPRQLWYSSKIHGRRRSHSGNWSITSAFSCRHQSIFNHLPMTSWGFQGQLWSKVSSKPGIFEGIHIHVFQGDLWCFTGI